MTDSWHCCLRTVFGHKLLIDTAAARCDRVYVIVCAADFEWVQDGTREYELVLGSQAGFTKLQKKGARQ